MLQDLHICNNIIHLIGYSDPFHFVEAHLKHHVYIQTHDVHICLYELCSRYHRFCPFISCVFFSFKKLLRVGENTYEKKYRMFKKGNLSMMFNSEKFFRTVWQQKIAWCQALLRKYIWEAFPYHPRTEQSDRDSCCVEFIIH